ncbi:MAG: gamma-glutamyltransferase [Rhodospirillales bacterium]|nr:gamma-glutamyltransferase [Rhodospirillales bacterium]
MITTLQPDAIEAGAKVLRSGGNAVDAALTCAFVQTVVDPMMCGIAGFGAMLVCMHGRGTHKIIDFHGRVPAAATPDMWQDRSLGETEDGFGFLLEDAVNDLGPGSALPANTTSNESGVRPGFTAPISTNLILGYLAEHVPGLQRSY